MALPRTKFVAESDESASDDDIGPALPPNYGRRKSDSSNGSCSPIGPGPVVPTAASNETTPSTTTDVYGPALPPSLLQQNQSRPIVGPCLPPPGTSFADYANLGGQDEDEEDDIIGPLPPGADAKVHDVAGEFEKRAERMRQKLTSSNDSDKLQRAEWMLELPPELNKNFGLGPRSFLRQTPAPTGDRSGWTQTPNDSNNKPEVTNDEDKKVLEHGAQEAYNKSMSQRTEDLNKSSKREKSLMEIHQKNLKRKKKKEEPKSKERRPFDRDEDLKANSFDDARRKALIKKSRQLGDKFSSGNQFL